MRSSRSRWRSVRRAVIAFFDRNTLATMSISVLSAAAVVGISLALRYWLVALVFLVVGGAALLVWWSMRSQ